MYEILSDSSISSLANKVDTRYSTTSLFGLIFDVTTLSECDYIVCTFSSQVMSKNYVYHNFHYRLSYPFSVVASFLMS